jgi:NAD(P)-dependent dehydrogenase (short-subunit alcohol dehydrogenase family)
MVTGAAKNTGLGIARRFAAAGWTLHLTSRSLDEMRLASDSLLHEFPNNKVYAYAMDIKDQSSIQAAFAALQANCPKLDVFVQNAANLGFGGSFFDLQRSDFDDVILTNVSGTFAACQAAAQLMRQSGGGGSIILLGSVTYRYCVRNRIAYITSKGAITSMTKAMALDCSQYRIRVNCVLPGTISTDRWDRMTREEKQKRRKVYPLRESDFADVANAVYYLAGEQAANVTGIELVVDGGASILAASEASLGQQPVMIEET